jgi:hypothetical protein
MSETFVRVFPMRKTRKTLPREQAPTWAIRAERGVTVVRLAASVLWLLSQLREWWPI